MFAMTSSLLYAMCALVNVATAQARNFSESASNDGMCETTALRLVTLTLGSK